MDEDELSSAEERGCTLSNVITIENINCSSDPLLSPKQTIAWLTRYHRQLQRRRVQNTIASCRCPPSNLGFDFSKSRNSLQINSTGVAVFQNL